MTPDGSKLRRARGAESARTGASRAWVVGLPAQAQAQSPEYRRRDQSLHVPVTSEWDKVVPRFVKRVSDMSNGRIQIQPFPAGTLVPSFEMLDAVGKGVVDIGQGAQVYWRGKIPFTLWTWGIPFAFRQLDHYDYLWTETELLDAVREAFGRFNVRSE